MKFISLSVLFAATIVIPLVCSCQNTKLTPKYSGKGKVYYLTADGNDAGTGSKENPWRSIQKLNSIPLQAGDTVFFEGGQTFSGNFLVDSTSRGTTQHPVVIISFGNTNAVINGGGLTALTVNNTAYIKIQNIGFIGSGRKNGNTKDGVAILHSNHIEVDSIDISGFQKSGLLVYASHAIEVKKVHAHDNGFAGISIAGEKTKESCSNIHVSGCAAINNPGDPTNLTNHSGNGIIAGYCKNVVIEYSTATNNGWDMPRTGNGPVGIWAYEADSVTIQYCISYKNKTSKGGEDGGGFDFDGGVTNSVIQHCLSYDNEGSGFGIFQYAGASSWHDNIIRNNISENDGSVSRAGASAFIWNGSRDKNQFKNLQFYNNILYNEKGAVLNYDNKESEHTGFRFHHNIFVAKDELVVGNDTMGTDIFLYNDWWSLRGGFNMHNIKNFKTWARQEGKEQKNGKIVGYNENPNFNNAGHTSLISPRQLKLMNYYAAPKNSKLRKNLPVY